MWNEYWPRVISYILNYWDNPKLLLYSRSFVNNTRSMIQFIKYIMLKKQEWLRYSICTYTGKMTTSLTMRFLNSLNGLKGTNPLSLFWFGSERTKFQRTRIGHITVGTIWRVSYIPGSETEDERTWSPRVGIVEYRCMGKNIV